MSVIVGMETYCILVSRKLQDFASSSWLIFFGIGRFRHHLNKTQVVAIMHMIEQKNADATFLEQRFTSDRFYAIHQIWRIT